MLTSLTFDPAGAVELAVLPSSDMGESRRRVTRTATLDGGAAFNDFGYTEADRTIELKWAPMKRDRESAVDRLVKTYSRLRLSTKEGCFLVAPSFYKSTPAESKLSLLVVEKLSED